MIKKLISKLNSPLYLAMAYLITASLFYFGRDGLSPLGSWWESNTYLKLSIYFVVMAHITISCMSISFHRYHTHKGVILNAALDTVMQTWLWAITSMSMLDWVSVHLYHHLHSDTQKDPHSPVTKGLFHVLFLGVFDYTKAKNDPEVLAIRSKLKTNHYEEFIAQNLFFGPAIIVLLNVFLFGVFWGTLLSVINFLISPIFAVGGVNAIAHWWGYRNHQSKDNSRNIGFIFPLNFIICGELDHNNHHAHQKSCSFRHKWFEFDIGYFYIKILNYLKLAKIKTAYNTKTFKQDMAKRAKKLMDYDFQFKSKCQQIAIDMNKNLNEIQDSVCAYIEGKKTSVEGPIKAISKELVAYLQSQNQFHAMA